MGKGIQRAYTETVPTQRAHGEDFLWWYAHKALLTFHQVPDSASLGTGDSVWFVGNSLQV